MHVHTKYTLAYITALIGRLYYNRRHVVTEEESVVLDTCSKVAFWYTDAHSAAEREVFDLVDREKYVVPEVVDYGVFIKFYAVMDDLFERHARLNRPSYAPGAKALMQRVAQRLIRKNIPITTL